MCKNKKRWVALVLAAALGLCSCATDKGTDTAAEGNGGQSPAESTGSGEAAADSQGRQEEPGEEEGGGLRFLCEPGTSAAVSSDAGYYYLKKEGIELKDGSYGVHLMYMDYETQQEIYLCSTAGCGHDTLDCPAVLPADEFSGYRSRLFLYRDGLYIINNGVDNDGTVTTMSVGQSLEQPESPRIVLYRANLDGTDRRPVYTLEDNLSLEELVLGDERGIYLITKELSMEQTENITYTTSAKRRMVRLDPEEGNAKEVCSMEFEGPISWQVADCSGNLLILSGIDYKREYTREEYWDDDAYKELYLNSDTVYATLNIDGGKKEEILRLSNQKEHSVQVVGDQLYFSLSDDGQIKSLDLLTGEEKVLCQLSQNLILDCLGDILCCRQWDLSADHTWYFVNTKTGEISHSGLVNLCNGWSLEFMADLAEDVLVIYDYDAQGHADGSYEIFAYKYALISKEDLLAGREQYRKIKMIGKGE